MPVCVNDIVVTTAMPPIHRNAEINRMNQPYWADLPPES